MERFIKWSNAEVKFAYKELLSKKDLTEEEKQFLEQLKLELEERGLLNE